MPGSHGERRKGKGALFFTSKPFQPKAKQQVGFEPGNFWSTVQYLNHSATLGVLCSGKIWMKLVQFNATTYCVYQVFQPTSPRLWTQCSKLKADRKCYIRCRPAYFPMNFIMRHSCWSRIISQHSTRSLVYSLSFGEVCIAPEAGHSYTSPLERSFQFFGCVYSMKDVPHSHLYPGHWGWLSGDIDCALFDGR